jgi:very-short-patch-repair endonuclease
MKRDIKHNWKVIQKYYSDGHTWKESAIKFDITESSIRYALKQKELISHHSKKETGKLISEKLSKIMKKVHEEGRHPGWLSVNLNKENRTYAEQYFLDMINFNKKIFNKWTILEKVQFSKYVLDFAILELKLDIEIDGQFHITDKKTIAKDKKRNRFLLEQGWRVFRIGWPELKDNREKIIKELCEFIQTIDIEDDSEINIVIKKDIGFIRCFRAANFIINPKRKLKKFKTKVDYNKYRKENYIPRENTRKVRRPSSQQLLEDLKTMSYCAVGRKYGVSDTCIRKWLKYYKKQKHTPMV